METPSFYLSILALIFGIGSFIVNYTAGRKVVRSSTYSSMMERLWAINKIELEKPNLFLVLHNEFRPITNSEADVELSTYLFMLFNLYSEIYTQREKYKLFDKDQMQIWKSRIENDFYHRPFLRGYWEQEKERSSNEFTTDFMCFIDEKLAKAELRISSDSKEETTE